MTDSEFEQLFIAARDPQSPLKNCPAGTTLLYVVCQNDSARFDEACRLIRIFAETALAREKQKAGVSGETGKPLL